MSAAGLLCTQSLKSPLPFVRLQHPLTLCHIKTTHAAALAKYGKGQSTDDLALAVEMLIERNLLPRLPPQAQLASNDFRTERLYMEEVRQGLYHGHTHTHSAAGLHTTHLRTLTAIL